MNKFTFIVGPVAAGKSTFMEKKLYNATSFLFDHDKSDMMIGMYGSDPYCSVNDFNLERAFTNAIKMAIELKRDFMMQIHFTNEQLGQINTLLHKYQNKFDFQAHYIGVIDIEILKDRAKIREKLGGHSSHGKSIEKSFNQSFKNFISFLPKLSNVTIWDNSEDLGFYKIEPQFSFKSGVLDYENENMTEFSKELLKQTTSLIQGQKTLT